METQLADFRKTKNEYMRTADSPLTPDDRAAFSGLKYFEENPALVFDVPLETNVPHDPITLQTSTGGERTYTRAGKVSVVVDETDVEVVVYEDEHGFFVPFRDATCGLESYSAGRYLEPEELPDGRLHVDFNYAYNPYCAYSPHFSCPLPPMENWLKVEIRAGEKMFKPES